VKSGFVNESVRFRERDAESIIRGLVGLALIGLAGFALGFTVLWAVDVFGGHSDSPAVLVQYRLADHDNNDDGVNLARTDDGVGLDLGNYSSDAEPGEAILVTRSTVTGQVTGVRSATDSMSLTGRAGLDFGEVAVPLLLAGTLLVFRRWVKWTLAAVPKLVAIGLPVIVFGVTVAVLVSGSPVRPDPGTPSPDLYAGGPSPQRYVPGDQPAVIGNLSVTVDGPISRRWPAGASPSLRDLAVVVVPIEAKQVKFSGDSVAASLYLTGDGGVAQAVRSADCDGTRNGVSGDFRLTTGSGQRGLACFVVPPRFQPDVLQVLDVRTSVDHGVGIRLVG
jgi:hypothetical protein